MADGSQAAASSDADVERAAASEGLLRWLRLEGAAVDGVRVGVTKYGGLGVLAENEIPAGGIAFRCPCRAVLTADMALEDPVIGPPLRSIACGGTKGNEGSATDQHQRLMLLLLHHRRLSERSSFAPYIQSLPGEELPASLPLNWPPDEFRRLLGGSQLFDQASDGLRQLRQFHKDVVDGQLCAKWPEAFPREHFGLRQLSWAHAVYWSRAIVLPLPSGARPCLVPLLDMSNHSPGTATRVTCERSPATTSTADGTCRDATGVLRGEERSPMQAPFHDGHDFVLRCSRGVAPGQEIHINYGAKGNAELLRCHGFVLPDNAADVFELDLAAEWAKSALFPDDGGDHGSRVKVLRTTAEERLEELRGSARITRHFLFRGGLPPELLPALRILFAVDGDELRRARAEVADFQGDKDADRGISRDSPVPQAFDWSLVDWAAEDPFAAANAAAAKVHPAGEECEGRALEGLCRLLASQIDAMQPALSGVAAEPMIQTSSGADEDSSRSHRHHAARVYMQGQDALLREALGTVRSLIAELGSPAIICNIKRDGAGGGDSPACVKRIRISSGE